MAKVPGRPNRSHFSKHDFHLDLAAGSCTCPAVQVTHTIVPAGKRTDRTVANLTLVLGKIGLSGSISGGEQATASSSMMSALWSPMLRPISAPSGSDNYGP